MKEKLLNQQNIRQELERQFNQKNNKDLGKPIKKYKGLKLNWKDAVIFCMGLFFTSLYQVQALAQDSDPELFDLSEIHSGMMLNYHKNTNNYSSVQLLNSDYSIEINGVVAYTKIKQQFHNNSQQLIEEAMYAFPIEHTGAVYDMKLKIGNRVIDGEIHEKKQAEKIFQQAKSDGFTASIVKQFRPNLFTTEVANILPNEKIEVEIHYQQILKYDQHFFEYRLPLKIKPRYFPAQNSFQTTKTFADSSHIGFDSKLAEDSHFRKINVKLNSGFELEQLKSLYHSVDIENDSFQQTIKFKDTKLADQNDFVLRWKPTLENQPKTALFKETINNETYALLMMMPSIKQQTSYQAREMVFIIDTSGSMHGKALNQAKDALLMALTELKANDKFNVIQFNSSAEELFDKSLYATPDNLNEAIEFIDSLTSNGGTNMSSALNLSMRDSTQQGFIKQIIFITDGAVGNESFIFQQISQNIGNSRLYTVAIGEAPNNYFMSKSAQIGRGTYTQIGDLNEVNDTMSALFKKLTHPVLTDINIDWKQNAEQSPKVIADMYIEQPRFITAKLSADNTNVSVDGLIQNKKWNQDFNLKNHKESQGIAKLWARQKIDDLTDDYMLGGNINFENLKFEITKLALKYNLVSKFTSLVAVDKNPDLSRLSAIEAMKRKSPKALSFASYPQTSSQWQKHVLLGFMFILLFALMRTFRNA